MKSKLTETEYEISEDTDIKSLKKTFQEGDTGDILSFSKYTLIGVSLVVLVLIFWIVIPDIDSEIGFGLIAIAGLFLLFFFVVDILRWRDFSDWGALGAFIAYLGSIFILIPLILNMIRFNFLILKEIGFSLYELFFILGVIFVFFGSTSRATELDQKIVDQAVMFWEWVKAGGIREALKILVGLIWTLITGIGSYMKRGVKELGTRLKRLGGWIKKSSSFVFTFLTSTFPKGVWNNLHWLGIASFIIYLSYCNLLLSNCNIELLLMTGFFFTLGIILPQKGRINKVINNSRKFVLKQTISLYSMLSGNKINPSEAIFCSRCLRGIKRDEFASLCEVKNTYSPECPFCQNIDWMNVTN